MNIHLRGTTLLWLLVVIITSGALITCGRVKSDRDPDAPVDDTCIWDQSQWDACTLAP